MSKVVLTFPEGDWKAARWVIDCFHAMVHESYSEGAPRRTEADKLSKELHRQAREQIGEDYDT